MRAILSGIQFVLLAVLASAASAAPITIAGYSITRVQEGRFANAPRPINNMGQVAIGTGVWTPFAPNGTSGSTTILNGVSPSAINDYGQVVGGPTLWSPIARNSTLGNTINLGAVLKSINNYGQVIGEKGPGCHPSPDNTLLPVEPCSGFLWTPSSPNSLSGNYNPDVPIFLSSLNDFGQAIGDRLYTPVSAHALTGTYSEIGAGLDINNHGDVVGLHTRPCAADSGKSCLQGNLWTPSIPNGTSGTTTALPIPAGFQSMAPIVMNASGHVVGVMTQDNGVMRPFLYRNGTVFDLGTISSDLSNAQPVGINDRGQIVLNAFAGNLPVVYLLTPPSVQLSADAVNPPSGSGINQAMTFTFSDPRGWTDLGIVNVLINNVLDGRRACYIAYSRPLNTLYLMNDAGTELLPGLTLGGFGSVGNSRCTIRAAGSSAVGNGNTLTLILNLGFSSIFAGNQVVYLGARDVAENSSGWQPLGTWNVPGSPATGPSVGGVSPAWGVGLSQTFTFTFADTKGTDDLGVVDIIINNALDGRHACYLAYSRPINALYLVGDDGDTLLPGVVLNGPASLANSQCAVYAGPAAVSQTGNTMTLQLDIAFRAAFSGNRVVYLAARDVPDTATSGWQAVGTWKIQ